MSESSSRAGPAPGWRPFQLGLLASACLHLALLFLLHPAPGSARVRTMILNARLENPMPMPSAGVAETPAPGAAGPSPQPLPTTDGEVTPPPAGDSAAQTMAPTTSPHPPEPTPPQSGPATAHLGGGQAAVATGGTIGPVSAPPLPTAPLGVDNTWYEARALDSVPRVIGELQPEYPEEARRVNLEGSLKLKVRIDEFGQVRDVEVLESTPRDVFDQAAVKALRQARFRPALRDGRPVRSQIYLRVDFKLEN